MVEEGEKKKSVLKKVKDKAKKIKDTIKKHGHGGDQRHHHQTNVDGGPSSSSYFNYSLSSLTFTSELSSLFSNSFLN